MKLRTLLILGLLVVVSAAACQQEPDPTPTQAVAVEETEATEAPTETAVPPTDEPTAEPPATEATEETDEETETTETADTTDTGDLFINAEEGGPVNITGVITYTNPFFTLGVAEPVIILEDQAGFVDRNESFLMPPESQTLGQITSDFFTSPFSYSLSLPIEPQGTRRDVDGDEQEEPGVQIFAVAYWTNTFGDPFLEERDLFGGGWSTAYASTRVSEDADTRREIIGGKLLVYAPDDEQDFPTSFGEDGLLFTDDETTVTLPQGYTVVNLDTEPFTFDRSRNQRLDLIEPEGAALVDYSDLSYSEAFNELVDQLTKEYAFTESKNIDWEALRDQFLPRFEEAEADDDATAYRRALRDFAWSIPDGHVSGAFVREDFVNDVAGGIGLAIRDVDDGRVIVTHLVDEAPAQQAGIELRAEILEMNGTPIAEFVDNATAYSAPFSTEHFRRLQKLRYAVRYPIGTEVEVTFVNPDETEPQTVTLEAVSEIESFNVTSFAADLTGFELPLDYQLLDSGYGYVKIYSFSDNELLTVQLWERMMRELAENEVPGLIIDMRQNSGGSGFLADQMAAYFFNEPLVLGNTGRYDEDLDEFYFDPRNEDRFYLPAEELRYNGPAAVLIAPSCQSACEFFSYDMTLQDRAAIVGHYPTAGLGGSIDRVAMPEDESFTFTQGRAVDADGDIHIEGKGVAPTVEVPVNESTLFTDGDPILQAAIGHLNQETEQGGALDGGEISLGEEASGELEPGQRVRYVLSLSAGDVVNLLLESDDFTAILSLYDEDDNFFGATDPDEAAAIEDLEIPFDLNLVLEVASENDAGEGAYTLRVEEASE